MLPDPRFRGSSGGEAPPTPQREQERHPYLILSHSGQTEMIEGQHRSYRFRLPSLPSISPESDAHGLHGCLAAASCRLAKEKPLNIPLGLGPWLGQPIARTDTRFRPRKPQRNTQGFICCAGCHTDKTKYSSKLHAPFIFVDLRLHMVFNPLHRINQHEPRQKPQGHAPVTRSMAPPTPQRRSGNHRDSDSSKAGRSA